MNVLECFGVGQVAEDKAPDTDEVLVYLPSLFPEADGEITAAVEKKDITIQSPTGDTNSSSGLSSNAVMMKWLPFNTNRISAPDVRKGSKVVVYKFKGQSTYRWMYFGMDGTLRLETVIYAFSATPNLKENAPLTPDNYYIWLISTHSGKVQFLTGKGNGEPTNYAITLDTKNGGFSLVDGEENQFVLNSMEHFWSFTNQEKSVFAIDKKKIIASCEDEMLLRAKEHIGLTAKKLTVDCQTFEMGATTSARIASPLIKLVGKIEHEGSMTQTGTLENAAGISSVGNISANGDVSAGNVSMLEHVHMVKKEGQDTDRAH